MPMEQKNVLICSYSPPPIGLHGYDLAVKHALHKILKFFEEFKHFIFTRIINEADIVFLIAKGVNYRTPHIGESQL
jgi:hypothetical protein